MMRSLGTTGLQLVLLALLAGTTVARADVALFLEEPYGNFGGMNPTGHAAIYLSRVCAASLVSVRRCRPGEDGVVVSRYHRIGGYDWITVPLIPYLYAVDHVAEVPEQAGIEDVARLRDQYRRKHLEPVAHDETDGSTPPGDWTQLIGAAYDRTIYVFEIQTSEEQDNQFIRMFNSRLNDNHFNILFHNCADFASGIVNFYYPKSIHRSFIADAGIMTPKQAALCLVRFGKRHRDLQFSIFAVAQVPGMVPRSHAIRGVLESVIKSKRYILPLAPLAVLHPFFGGSLALAWAEERRFNPRRLAAAADSGEPGLVAKELQSNAAMPLVAVPPDRAGTP